MRFIHSADWQLGKSYGRFGPDIRAALTEARFDVIDTLGRAACEHNAQHIVVAGDVFDTEGPEDRTIIQAISRMTGSNRTVHRLSREMWRNLATWQTTSPERQRHSKRRRPSFGRP